MNTCLRLFSWTTLFCCTACSKADDSTAKPAATPNTVVSQSNEPLVKPALKASVITLGGGCFWCVEAVYQRIEGITKVTSGYMGGKVPNPTYKHTCTGRTGHAEVVQVEFDPEQVTYGKLLGAFWECHDPTQLNQQGPDFGTQYRSAIFCHGEVQLAAAQAALEAAQPRFDEGIVTQVEPAQEFWRAEEYHQKYFENNPNAACHI